MSRTIKKAKTGGKRVSRHCQNHGGCEYCYSNRLIHTLKELDRTNIKSFEVLDALWHDKNIEV